MTYRNDKVGFSIGYPKEWSLKTNDVVVLPDASLKGVSFIFPAAPTKSVLLDAKLSVVTQPKCPAQTNTTTVNVGTHSFIHSSWSDAGAGNVYEGEMYTTPHRGACLLVVTLRHRCNLGPDCGTDHNRPLDEGPLLKMFGVMEQSIQLF